ncbi:hypothetical protein [Aureimonas sp. AU20]|nr:hypothetical protein [Aureimonas sp. AU20]
MDPDKAVRVARSEGLAPGVYQSTLGKNGRREPSYGPFQLLVGGEGTGYGKGLGNAFIEQTGLDPRDPSTVQQQIDFALDQAKAGGWSPWYGAAKAGIGKWDGIRAGEPSGVAPTTQIPVTGSGDTMAFGGAGDDTLGGDAMASTSNPGGLGGLGGFARSDGFGDWLSAIGASLMSSPSNNPLQGFSENLSNRQGQRQRQDALDIARAEKANDRAAMRSLLVSRGFTPQQAEAYSSNPSVANAAMDGLALDEAKREKNVTRDWLRQNHPDLADLPIDVAVSLANQRRSSQKEANDASQRESLAERYGIDPNSPEGQRFILTGTLPAPDKGVTAGDRLAIREADDIARDGDGVIGLLDEALKLSPDAYEGATAGARTWMGNNLPDWAVPDGVADAKTAQATKTYDNIITTQALGSLKAIFGGAPTEGERAILLDVQGMSSQPKAVREEIIKRAKAAVQRRVEFNRDRASELRGGTYYKPRVDGAPPAAAPVAAPTVPASDADPLGLR